MRLGIPFGDQALWKADGDIHGLLFVAVEIDHRRLHPLQRDEMAFAERVQCTHREAVYSRLGPIIDKPGKLCGLERIPLDQNAVGTLHRRECAPFMRYVIRGLGPAESAECDG